MTNLGLDLIGADDSAAAGKVASALLNAGSTVVDAFTKPSTPPPAAQTAAPKPEEESFLSKPLVGPVRVWHSLLGAGVAIGGGLLWWKK